MVSVSAANQVRATTEISLLSPVVSLFQYLKIIYLGLNLCSVKPCQPH